MNRSQRSFLTLLVPTAISFLSTPALAASLILIEGHSSAGEAQSSESALIGRARANAKAQAGTTRTRVSSWRDQHACGPIPYAPEFYRCTAWSQAMFVDSAELGQDWEIELTGEARSVTPPGQADEWLYSVAEQQADRRAEWACGGRRFESRVKERSSRDEGYGGERYVYRVRLRYRCLASGR